MDVQEKYTESLSDLATAFTIALVGLCRGLEQQHKIMPDSIARAIHAEIAEVPKGSTLHTTVVKEMVLNIAKAINGARITDRIPQGTR